MHLETAEIDRYGLLRGCRPRCNGQLSIVAGPNESGKTLFLEGILQLMDPAVERYLEPGPRVEEPPVGRVILQTGAERHSLGPDRPLSDVSPIEPRHLATLFVIRDSDLALPAGPDYFTELVDHLGDIHTAEIASLREGLREVGRLTETRLDLANWDYDTKRIHERTATLGQEVDAYLSSARDEGLADAVQERVSTGAELTRIEEELARQERARDRMEVETATAELEQYRQAADRVTELGSFDRDTLEAVRSNEREVERLDDRIADLSRTIDNQDAKIDGIRERHRDATDERRRLERRADAVDEVEAALETFRDARDQVPDDDFDDPSPHVRNVAVAGLAGGGVGLGGGAIAGGPAGVVAMGAGVVLLFLAAVAGLFAYRHRRQVEALERAERTLLRTARDAGFEVSDPGDVGPAIRDFNDRRDMAAERERTLDAKLEEAERGLAERRNNIDELRKARIEAEETVAEALTDAGVQTVDEFAAHVEEREQLERRLTEATGTLTQLLVEPPSTDPPAAIDAWEAALERRRKEGDAAGIEADRYDESRLEALSERRDRLATTVADLDDEIGDFERRLEDFARRAGEIEIPPFVDVTPRLEARTIEGLADLRDQLAAVVDRIEENADRSRRAIEILDGINRDEEAKVSTLFEPGGPAERTLSRLTGGRYVAVVYDPAAETLAVERSDGVTLTPEKLSRATRDQLYFAARLSLAQQLLGGDSGFLLLDDPFLAADPTRLREGFETLSALADDGWQIIYLTAKSEVSEDVGPAFGCPVEHLDVLEF